MLKKARIFPDQERIDKKRRDLVEVDLDPVRAGETAVNFAVDVEDGIALRHVAAVLGVKPTGPAQAKQQ